MKMMKKIIPAVLLLLMLIGCEKQQKETVVKQEINPGQVNFAAILVLDDLIANGLKSDFLSLSPISIVNPNDAITAEHILEDFRKDFVAAKDQYPLKLSEGIPVTWNIDHNADTQYGLFFHKEERTKNTVFAGKLALRFDPEYYSTTTYPVYAKNDHITVICRVFSGAAERKNNYLTWIEVAFDRCMTVPDYYASLQVQLKNQLPPIKERLNHIYAGKEEVSEVAADKLMTYYLAGQAFLPNSICLTGGREACLSSLKSEILKKYESVPITEKDAIQIRIADTALPEDKSGLPTETTEKPIKNDRKNPIVTPLPQKIGDEEKSPAKTLANENAANPAPLQNAIQNEQKKPAPE